MYHDPEGTSEERRGHKARLIALEFLAEAVAPVAAKDGEPWSVVGGNPAKFIKKRVISG